MALALTSVSPARGGESFAPTPIALSELLARARTAEGVQTRGAYHIVLRGTSDGDTTVEETFSSSEGYKTTETTADIASSWGTYRGQRWYRNPNGFVQLGSGVYEQHDPIENAVRNIGEGSGATLLGVSAAPATYAVRITPREGLSETRYYDTGTYLLRRVDLKDYDGHTRIVEYDDYRKVYGRMVPFVRTYRGDFYKGSRRYDVVTYQPVPKDAIALAIPASTTLFDLGGRDSVTIPADFTDDGIIVRMNVGKRGLDLLLDSGASSIVVNASVATDLGLTLHNKRTESLGGTYSAADARISDVSVGSLHARAATISVAPVDYNVAPTERAVGLLGCDFFTSGALQVDFTRKALTLYAKAPTDLRAAGWTEVPIDVEDCVPLVKAAFSGAPGEFIIDLGAYQTVLYEHYFSQFKASSTPSQGGEPLVSEGSFIGGDDVRFQAYRMRTLGIGDLLFADAVVNVPLAKAVQERDYDGLLGRPTLTNFNILFDYAHQRVYLKPSM